MSRHAREVKFLLRPVGSNTTKSLVASLSFGCLPLKDQVFTIPYHYLSCTPIYGRALSKSRSCAPEAWSFLQSLTLLVVGKGC